MPKTCKSCTKIPVFGNPETKIAEYCKTHAPSDYIDIKNKTCKSCTKIPVFGKPGTKIAEYCKTHAPSDYIDIKHKTCLNANCTKIPAFGKPGTKIAEYCKTHAPSDYIDIISKTCLDANCTTRASFGIPGYSAEYCAKHKKEKMVIYPAKYKDGFIECVICLVKIHYSEKYCKNCYYYLENGITKLRHKKELEIKNLLDENKIEFTHDLKVKDGCSKKRPDFIIHKKWGTIILEIDEFQHNRKNYPCICEITRMKQLYFDVGVKNLLFVRYNPDKYKHIHGQKNYNPNERHTYLIKYLEELKTHANLGVVYLFYDGFINPPEIENLNPYL